MLPECNTQQHIGLEMKDYKDKTKEELLEIIRKLEEQLENRTLPDSSCQDEDLERFRKQYGKEILDAIPDMLTVFDYNLDYIELLSSPDTNHVEGLSGEDKSHPNLKDIVPESEYRKIRANMEKVMRTGCPSIGEHSLWFEGEMHHYENLVCPLGDKYLLCMCRDVTSRVNALRELAAARVKAEESDRLKSAFLSNMSHEIRTPLNALSGFSDVLTTPGIDEETRKQCNDIIQLNSRLLLNLVNDVVDISCLDVTNMKFNLKQCNAVNLCEGIIQTLEGIKQTQAEIFFRTELPSLEIETDTLRLHQVLINILVNATKFTKEGSIILQLEQNEEGMAQFSITDTGCGIPSEKQNSIFERFERVNEKSQGTGLGLAICQLIISRLGGKIWIDPQYTDGSRFVFTHPLKQEGRV